MKIRTLTTVAALAVSPTLVAPSAQATPASTAATVAAARAVAVPGIPMTIGVPSGWPTFSPKSLYNSKTRTYPASVRYVARIEKMTPAKFLAANRTVNLMAYGGATRAIIPVLGVADVGQHQLTVAQLKEVVKGIGGTIATTSQVKTRFGTSFRVHYTSSATNGRRANGVMALLNLKGRAVLVDSSAASSSLAVSTSDLALKTANWR